MTRAFDVDAVVALAQALVRLPTAVAPGVEEVETAAAALLADTMRGFGWAVTVDDVECGRPNVVAVIDGTGPGRTLMFEGHVDVVTPGEVDSWSFPPYSGDVVDGRLLGRGSADMKAGVAAMIHAARAVQQQGFPGRIIVGILADEEGMMLGAKDFARSDLAGSGIDGVIVCEPEGGEVCAVAKGAIRMRVDLQGVMAHGAMPHQGRNSLPALGSLLMGLSELERQISESVGSHPHLGNFYLTPTVLAAGDPSQVNVIPASASVWLDIRTIPGVGHQGLLHLITRLAEQIADDAGLTVAITVIDDRPPVNTPETADVVRALVLAHETVTGRPAVLGGVPGTTDGTILTRDAGLETVVYGPGGKWIAHTKDEFVAVEDILTCTEVYIEAALRFLDAPRPN
ncbi:succinyl-diaminopimelate desuccinylase [Nakamurella panacisegetis]|uniref:Probable succinyl-diaminopimelate desuccinylase n=1 Tax=Nakamurella panacisegetis TaxID=1090615 RepID=A0A1H0SET9_9ACTN|nr:M20 family metallopeptidase [Nakamurella panacisegetis]SDP40029.1 succinyl-diaminopimelate desuccinylase [Nakamurella panacisegetis]